MLVAAAAFASEFMQYNSGKMKEEIWLTTSMICNKMEIMLVLMKIDLVLSEELIQLLKCLRVSRDTKRKMMPKKMLVAPFVSLILIPTQKRRFAS